MRNKNFTDLKFLSNMYLKIKNNRLEVLDINIKGLQQKIIVEKDLLTKDKQHLDNLLKDNNLIKENYQSVRDLFQSENKTITIRNNNYSLALGENVFIKKKLSRYIIHTRQHQDIYVFPENMNGFMDTFLALDFSINVVSIHSNKISLQFRLR